MFKNQVLLQNKWNEITGVLARYDASAMVEPLKPKIDNFVVKVPLVGIFSAGKSTLINSLLDEKLLSVQVSPETAVATELYHTTEQERLIGFKANGDSISISKQELREQNLDAIVKTDEQGKQGWVEAYLNSDILARFPHISIVDLPGLDSNLISHNQVIDRYVEHSLAYCIVVSIEDGDIRESTQQFLQQLNLSQMPVILVLTKSDLKPKQELNLIKEKMIQSVTGLLDQSPLQTVMVNRKGENIEQLIEAFEAIEAKSEILFNNVIVSKIIEQLAFTEQGIDKLLNMEDVSIEQLQIEKEMLQKDIQEFSKKIEQDGAHLQSKTATVIQHIADSLENQLISQVEFLASQLLAEQDISHMVTNIARQSVSQGLQQELAPLITTYVDSIQAEMPASIQIDKPSFDADIAGIQSGLSASEIILTLAPVLALLKFNPILAVISTVVLPAIAKVVDLFRSENQRKAQQIAREEATKNAIIASVIPKVRYEVEQSLYEVVTHNINTALQKMQTLVASREQQIQAQILQKEKDIQATTDEREKRHESYRQDKDFLSRLREQLSSASL